MEIHGNSWKFMEFHGNSWEYQAMKQTIKRIPNFDQQIFSRKCQEWRLEAEKFMRMHSVQIGLDLKMLGESSQ